MNYEDFISLARRMTEERAGEDVLVALQRITKNNGVVLDALIFSEKHRNISPTIYLREFYEYFLEHPCMPDVVEKIWELYQKQKLNAQIDNSFFTDYNKVKSHLSCRLINQKKNAELLEKIPHIIYLDLALVACCQIENEKIGNGSVLIHNRHLEIWGVVALEMMEDALKNIRETQHFQMFCMHDLIFALAKECFQESIRFFELPQRQEQYPMFVLTNQERCYGAIAIYFPEILQQIGEWLEDDFYILPSSVHECMIVPQKAAGSVKEMVSMVREINQEQLPPEEVLSNIIYLVKRNDGTQDDIYRLNN